MKKSPGLTKRILVIIYDALLMAGVVFAAQMVLFLIIKILPVSVANTFFIKTIHFSCLVAVSFFFYAWFWVNGGQTLGMKTWKLYLVKEDNGKFLCWKLAFKRYCLAVVSWAVLGMGFVWILINRDNKTWHDILTKTRIVNIKN